MTHERTRLACAVATMLWLASTSVAAQRRGAPIVAATVESMEGRDEDRHAAIESAASAAVRSCAPASARVRTVVCTAVHVQIAPDGSARVEPVGAVRTRPEGEAATTRWGRCVVRRLAAARFPAGEPARATLSVQYSVPAAPGSLYGGQIHMPRVIVSETRVAPPSLATAIALRIVRRHLNEVRFCYEQQLAAAPGYETDATLEMNVAPTGAVTATHAHLAQQPTDLASASERAAILAIETCLGVAGRRWQFPPPGPAPVVVTLTVTLLMPDDDD